MQLNLNKPPNQWDRKRITTRRSWPNRRDLSHKAHAELPEKRTTWTGTRLINPVLILIACLNEDEDYDADFLKPTVSNFHQVFDLIKKVYSSPPSPSQPYVTADGVGGVRLRWVNKNKEIRLQYNSSLDKGSYIYHQQDDQYDVDYLVNSDNLKKWLNWLVST